MRIGKYFTQMMKVKSGKESNLLLIIILNIFSSSGYDGLSLKYLASPLRSNLESY